MSFVAVVVVRTDPIVDQRAHAISTRASSSWWRCCARGLEMTIDRGAQKCRPTAPQHRASRAGDARARLGRVNDARGTTTGATFAAGNSGFIVERGRALPTMARTTTTTTTAAIWCDESQVSRGSSIDFDCVRCRNEGLSLAVKMWLKVCHVASRWETLSSALSSTVISCTFTYLPFEIKEISHLMLQQNLRFTYTNL